MRDGAIYELLEALALDDAATFGDTAAELHGEMVGGAEPPEALDVLRAAVRLLEAEGRWRSRKRSKRGGQ